MALFVLGWTCKGIYADFQDTSPEPAEPAADASTDNNSIRITLPAFFSTPLSDKDSPYDRIKEDQIHVYADRIVIDLASAEWASFTDSNSMDPVIDFGSNAIEIVPNAPEDIHVGDIVSYESKYASGTIIHRVIATGHDEDGWYARLKGDNLKDVDPGKVRFDQIKRIVIAIIY